VDTWGALHQAASMNFWVKFWQKVTQFSKKGRIFYDKSPFFQNNCQIVTENCFVFGKVSLHSCLLVTQLSSLEKSLKFKFAKGCLPLWL
jgi:hypothetical protein